MYKTAGKVIIAIVLTVLTFITVAMKHNYKEYEEYRDFLIREYGEDEYKRMNEEAGIKNEKESFQHYLKYEM